MGIKEIPDGEQNPACRDCAVLDRRGFLRDASLAVASVLVALGAVPSRASAAPLEFITALGGGREDKSYPIPAKDGTQIDKDNQTIVTRWQNEVYVFSLACPHQNTALRWDAGNNRFQCPKHKSKYRPDGTFIEGRATRSMDRYAVRLAGNNVVVDIDKLYQEDTDNALWQHAVVALP